MLLTPINDADFIHHKQLYYELNIWKRKDSERCIIYTNYNTFDLITFHLSYPEDRVDHSRSISALGPVCPLGRGQTSLSCPTCSKPPMWSIK